MNTTTGYKRARCRQPALPTVVPSDTPRSEGGRALGRRSHQNFSVPAAAGTRRQRTGPGDCCAACVTTSRTSGTSSPPPASGSGCDRTLGAVPPARFGPVHDLSYPGTPAHGVGCRDAVGRAPMWGRPRPPRATFPSPQLGSTALHENGGESRNGTRSGTCEPDGTDNHVTDVTGSCFGLSTKGVG